MKLRYGRIFTDKLDGTHGLPRTRLQDLLQRFPTVLAEVRARRREGEYGFYELGEQADTVAAIRRFAEGVGQAYDHVLVLGKVIDGKLLDSKAEPMVYRETGAMDGASALFADAFSE